MAGDLASRAVVEVLPAQLRKAVGGQRPEVGGQRSEIRPPNSDLRSPLTAAAVERVREAVAGLSRTMHRESAGQPGLAGMGATLVLAIVRAGRALVLHMGDSRVYLYRGGELQRLTKDHTIVQALLDARAISGEEAQGHPARNELTRFVGMPGEPLPDVRLLDLLPGDQLLLCTDGLSGMLSERQMRTILANGQEPQTTCDELVKAANVAGGKDNVTVLLIVV